MTLPAWCATRVSCRWLGSRPEAGPNGAAKNRLRALLVLWLLSERRYEFGGARRTILADFELHDGRLGVEQRG